MAPQLGAMKGHMPPTAGTAVDTATPSIPVRSQRAAIEKVLSSSIDSTSHKSGLVFGGLFVCVGNCSEQRASIGVLGIGENIVGSPNLDYLTEPHDRDTIADIANDTQVVADEKIGQPKVALGLLEKIKHLGLYRHIESGCRLIRDNERRLYYDGTR